MVELTKDQFKEAVWDAGLDADSDIYWDYSGKGMYGASCLGITCTEGELLEFVAYLARLDDQLDLDWLRGVRSDSMGMSSIFYFPSLKFQEEED